ncbi:MAG: 3-dehydroquinate synthase [Firmicutes bacterium]|nr:3-dehydroquinate synthase [Bacillota bacterium]
MKLNELGKEVANIQEGGAVAIITDSNVAPLYLDICEESIKAAGFNAASFVIPAGEKSKNGATYLDLLEKLAGVPLTRSDGIVALGGGVVGDIAGFIAATYMRGIKLYQVPTTLLAMVDSSIGGKTGIDLEAGKNLAGAFYLPNLIFRDTETLKTLPDDVFREGMAEVIKYGLILDAELFDKLDFYVASKDMLATEEGAHELTSIIDRCAQLKNDIVAADFRDTGARQLLNFGHTIGHAIEKLSDYKVSHGDAVAKGMLRITEISAKKGWCGSDVTFAIENILVKYGFDLGIPYSNEEIFSVIKSDKKRRGSEIEIVVPETIGKCTIKRVSMDALWDCMQAAH